MNEYKFNPQANNEANQHITNMQAVLEEIATTYAILLEVVEQQEAAIGSPAINAFRADFKQKIDYGVKLAQRISEDSSALVDLSQRTSQHLQALEGIVSPVSKKAATSV